MTKEKAEQTWCTSSVSLVGRACGAFSSSASYSSVSFVSLVARCWLAFVRSFEAMDPGSHTTYRVLSEKNSVQSVDLHQIGAI